MNLSESDDFTHFQDKYFYDERLPLFALRSNSKKPAKRLENRDLTRMNAKAGLRLFGLWFWSKCVFQAEVFQDFLLDDDTQLGRKQHARTGAGSVGILPGTTAPWHASAGNGILAEHFGL